MVNFTVALLHCWTGYAVTLSTFWVYKYVVKMAKFSKSFKGARQFLNLGWLSRDR